MSRFPIRIIVFALLGLAPAGQCAVHRAVKDSAKNYNFLEIPVSASVPAKAGSVIVKSLDTGDVVPSQVERDGRSLRVTWISRAREARSSKGYRIEFTDRPAKPDSGGVRLKKGDGAVDVTINGRPFTRYVYTGAPKPYCYPIIGPTGKPVTRNFPTREVEGESRDHPHHRSLWFTFGEVSGVNFWTESSVGGKIVHKEFDKLVSGPVYGRIVARNDWMSPEGKKVCEDTRDLRIYRTASGRIMDFEITIRATDGPVKFVDTKEGMFGIRVACSMEVDRGKGHIENARGDKDGAAWGKQAEWCDYYGPVDGETVGIAIMDHPTSFRYPTYWHVRTYGLFAANPFGLKAFTSGSIEDGSCTIPAGGKITFRYRIFIHRGTTGEAGVAEAYGGYSRPPNVAVK